MKRVMFYNHGGCGNRGCEALVRSTSALFAPHAQIVLTSGEVESDRAVGFPDVEKIVSDRISPRSLRRIINSICFRLGMPHEQEVARKHATVTDLGKRSDVCLSIGGDTYCYRYQEHLHVINARLKKMGKPLVLWGCSVDPERLQGQTLEDLRAYDLIVARESITEAAMKQVGLPVIRWCDPAFTMGREELPLPQGWREGKTVGVNVSPLVLSCAQDGIHALDVFAALIDHILSTSDNAVALIPHVIWGHDNDLDALHALKARFADEPRVFVLPGSLNALQLKGYISRLRLLVTARTHASIAGYSTAVPTLVIGYSVKAKGIARDLFGEEAGHLIPVQELSGESELIAAYEALLGREHSERAFLEARLPQYVAGREAVVASIMALVK